MQDDLSYFNNAEFKESLRKYEEMLLGATNVYLEADELTDIAEYYEMVVHDSKKCDKVLEYALQVHPEALDPAIFQARRFMMAGDLETASARCQQIPDQVDREVCFLKAEILMRQQKNSEALNVLYQNMSAQDEQDMYLYDASFVLVDYHAYLEAHALAGVLEKMSPEWFKTWEVMAAINIGLEHYSEVIPYTEKMIAVDTFFVPAWENKGEALLALQRYIDARECIDYVLAINPTHTHAMEMKAEICMNTFEPEQAHQLYQQLIAADSFTAEHYLNDAYCLLQIGNYEEALSQAQIAEQLDIDEDDFSMQIQLVKATLYSKLHRYDQALSTIDAFRDKASDTDSKLLCIRGKIFAEAGREEEARKAFEDYLQVQETDRPNALYNISWMLIDAELYQLANFYLNQIEDNDISKLSVPNAKGFVYFYKMICAFHLHNLPVMLNYLKMCIDNPVVHFDILFRQYVSRHLTPEAFLSHYADLLDTNTELPF